MYDDLPSKELVSRLAGIAQDIPRARKTFEELANITEGMSDVREQSIRQVALLDNLAEVLPNNRPLIWLRYRYRPQKRLIGRAKEIQKSQAESLYEYLRKYGPTDISRLPKKNRKQAENLYNDGNDMLHGIMEARLFMQILRDRHGAYDGYLGDWAKRVIEIILTAVVGALVALITNSLVS